MEAFEKTRYLISSTPVLSYYDVKKPVTVSADASSYGLGGVLLQEINNVMKPIAFCCRTLTSCESRYAQIEKECLASVWACEKLDRYIRGHSNVTLLTEHKPLVPLMNAKELDDTPVRCQRLLMRLMKYDIHAKHMPGKEMLVSDALSRSPIDAETVSTTASDVELHVQMVETCLPASDEKKDAIRQATKKDCITVGSSVHINRMALV